MLRDKIIAAIRTGCAVWGPALLTALATLLASGGVDIELDSSWGLALSGLLFAVLVAVYNLVVNLLATHVWPGFGWLLGVNQAPEYSAKPGAHRLQHVEEGPDGADDW